MRSISICIVVEIRGNSHEEVCVCLCVECVLECLCRVCSMVWTEEIRWVHPGASHVEIASSIDGWSSRHALIRDEDGAFCLKCDLESDSDVIYYKVGERFLVASGLDAVFSPSILHFPDFASLLHPSILPLSLSLFRSLRISLD